MKTVHSSNGEVECDDDGRVTSVIGGSGWTAWTADSEDDKKFSRRPSLSEEEKEGLASLQNIERFDFEEYRRAYPDENFDEADDFDILDLGFWTKDGKYVEPEPDFREDVRLNKETDDDQPVQRHHPL